MTVKTPPCNDQVLSLYESYAAGAVDRREFMRRATALGIAGVAASALGPLAANPSAAATRPASFRENVRSYECAVARGKQTFDQCDC